MKTRHLLGAAVLLLSSAPAAAQPVAPPVPLTRADLSASIGWFHARVHDVDRFGRALHAGGTGGWYWTDQLKTEVEVGATSAARAYGVRSVVITGRPTYTPIEYTITTRKLMVAQLYQALRNQWVHPYAGAALEVTWERITERHGQTIIYDPVRPFPDVLPERTLGPYIERVVRPVGVAGLKAYVTPRVFLRFDLRVAFRGGVDEVLLRSGLGVDF
jgi:hypothetical protein